MFVLLLKEIDMRKLFAGSQSQHKAAGDGFSDLDSNLDKFNKCEPPYLQGDNFGGWSVISWMKIVYGDKTGIIEEKKDEDDEGMMDIMIDQSKAEGIGIPCCRGAVSCMLV